MVDRGQEPGALDRFGKLERTLESVWAHPRAYIWSDGSEPSALGLVANVLLGVFGDEQANALSCVTLSVSGTVCTVTVSGPAVSRLGEPPSDLARLFDVSDPAAGVFLEQWPLLGFIQPLVWFADFASVEVAQSGQLIGQGFVQGQAVGDQTTYQGGGTSGQVRITFAPSPQRVLTTVLDVDQFRNLVRRLRQELRKARQRAGDKEIALHVQVQCVSDHDFVAQVTASGGT